VDSAEEEAQTWAEEVTSEEVTCQEAKAKVDSEEATCKETTVKVDSEVEEVSSEDLEEAIVEVSEALEADFLEEDQTEVVLDHAVEEEALAAEVVAVDVAAVEDMNKEVQEAPSIIEKMMKTMITKKTMIMKTETKKELNSEILTQVMTTSKAKI